MKHNTCLLWMAVICGLLLSLQGCRSQPADTVTLSELLISPGCKSACWQGIEPEVTYRDQLIEYLEEGKTNYTTIPETPGTGVEYFDWSDGNTPLASEGESILINVAVGDTPSQVGYISIGQVDLCVSTVIRDFGLPTAVSADDTSYTLAYPSEGVVFLTDARLMWVYSFSIRSEQVIEQEWVNRLASPVPQDGSAIQDLIPQDCEDNF